MHPTPLRHPSKPAVQVDVIVVGAGFAGMYALHSLRQRGFSVQVFERGTDVGGVWYWNRYPGARCDIDSMEYSYSFDEALQQEWEWTERFASQPEILRYAQHVADRFDLRRHIRFGTSVESAHFDERSARWHVTTGDGAETVAQFLILAVGCLSNASVPSIPGMERFRGEIHHTGHWPHEGVALAGKRVGLVGTGSSGVQAIPEIARQAGELTVFQRTATYTVPARNGPLNPDYVKRVKSDYAGFRKRNRQMVGGAGADRLKPETRPARELSQEDREQAFLARWQAGGMGLQSTFPELRLDIEANQFLADFMRRKIRETVADPERAEVLTPKHVAGCKRMCLDSGYYEAFNRPNVRVVDVARTPIEEFTEDGVRVGGELHALDCLVFATGYDAMTGAMLAIDIRGRGGLTLREAWAAGPRTYLGVGTVGFPNLFIMAGPGSPSVLANVIVAIEQHVEWVSACLDYMRSEGAASIEATLPAQDDWVEHVNAVASKTLYTQCNSWYLGANVPGKPRVFMPLIGFPAYAAKCDEVAARGYEGFVLAPGGAAQKPGPRQAAQSEGAPL
jgi:cation diffusion facilitator CzcD-associated flavoprotein CzcO